jgi:hypothetical protein
MAGALLPASVEGGDPHDLVLGDGAQLDDPWAYDERYLFPTGDIQRKPYWEWERSRHRAAHVTQLGVL